LGNVPDMTTATIISGTERTRPGDADLLSEPAKANGVAVIGPQ